MLVLILVVATPFAAFASADSNGGLLFDINSISLDGDGQVGIGSVWVNLTVSERLGDYANATLRAELSTIEGSPVVQNEVVNSTAGSTHIISFHFSSVAVGLYTISLNLSGDLDSAGTGPEMSTGSNWTADWNGIISRLRPLSTGLAPSSQWSLVALDAGGNLSSAPQDGDNVTASIPVLNHGDVNGSGLLNWTLANGSLNGSQSVISSLDSSSLVVIELGILSEGDYNLDVTLEISGDTDLSDNEGALSFTIAPPPLPLLSLTLFSSNADDADLGDTSSFVLNVSNSGPVAWSGSLECSMPTANTVVYSESLSLPANSNWTDSLTITASPGSLSCDLRDGGRISLDSSPVSIFTFTMQAAEFISVGGGNLTITNGQWHVGDVISTNLLIYNGGSLDGSARLYMRHQGSTSSGQEVMIPSGSSGQLQADLAVSEIGISIIDWWVSSLDGTVTAELSGNFSITVAQEQDLSATITNVKWSAETGVSLDWEVELSNGPSRVVAMEIGFRIDGIDNVRQNNAIILSGGKRMFSVDLGHLSGQGEVYVKLAPEMWLPNGTGIAVAPIPSERPLHRLVHQPNLQPEAPLPGTSATATCSLYNDGQAASIAGIIRLIGSDGHIYDEQTSPALSPSSKGTDIEMQVDSWPSDDLVELKCWWRVGDDILISEQSHISGQVETESESMLSLLPLTHIFYGVIFAIVITLCSRLAYGWKNADPEVLEQKKHAKAERKKKAAQSQKDSTVVPKSAEKVEVACTSCAQKLSVPRTFSGTVRCPSCRHEFDVEGVPDVAIPAPVTDASEEIRDSPEEDVNNGGEAIDSQSIPPAVFEDEEFSVSSKDDILSCPKCVSKLRVPLEKRPVKARCPACKTEFMAKNG